MTNRLGAVGAAAGYAYETALLARPLARLTVEAAQDETTRAFLNDRYTTLSVAAMGIGAAGRYDMEYAEGTGTARYNATIRHRAKINGALTMLALNVADDVIDRRSGTDDEKMAFFADVSGLLYGQEPATDRRLLRSDPEKAAAVDVATRVGQVIARPPEKAAENLLTLQQVWEKSLPDFAAQMTETNPQRLLELVIRLGAVCYDVVQVHVDIASPGHNDQTTPAREAGRLLGSYAHVLDHYYELDDDLRDGTHTYATAMTAEAGGDSLVVRQSIRELCLDTASGLYAQGKRLLTPEQAVTYGGLRLLIDAEFKVPIRRRIRLPRSRRTPAATTVNPAI